MHRTAKLVGVALVVIAVAGLLTACAGETEDTAAEEQARQEELTKLEEQKQALEAKREELAQLEQRLEEGPPEEPAEAEEAEGEPAEPMTEEEVQARIAELRTELDEESKAFYDALVRFINADPPIQGEPMTEVQRTAIRMKTDEDILVAEEYIEKGGNYSQAISIYQQALSVDPDNERLQAALEQAQAERFMTEERFSQVKKGMTEDQVRETLGQPLHYNVRTYEDRGVTAWLYPKNEQREAAAVYFRKKGDDLEVYDTDFDAVKPEEAEGS